MKYVRISSGSAYLPKLLGTYERELWPVWSRLTRACFGGTLINIGAAEGYYAIGALRTGAFSRVVCYESDLRARNLLKEMARLNHIHAGLELNAHCEPDTLNRCLQASAHPVAVICDVEGYEDALLEPGQVPELLRCHLLIELHEDRRPGVKDRLYRRFQATHEIKFIPSLAPTLQDLPQLPWPLDLFPTANKLRWLDELRDIDTPWYYMVPRDSAAR